MRKRFTFGTVIGLMLLAAATTFTLTYMEVRNEFNKQLSTRTELERELTKFIEIKQTVEKSFIGEYDENKMIDGAMAGIVDSLGDKWSYYLSAEEFKRYIDSNNNEYVGIGITASYNAEAGGVQVDEIYNNSPAFEAGIRQGDIIIEIDGEPTADMSYDMVVSRIRGVEGTALDLKLRRNGGNIISANVTRRKIHIDVITSEIIEGNIGLVKIANFDANQFIEFETALNRLINADVKGIIFDVRFNPGGQLKELLKTLDMLLPEGVIFNSKSKDGKEETYSSAQNSVDIPMSVIVNAGSYSAAEYFAAALQEYDWAVVVGTKTTGKGYAQIPIPLSDGSALVLSTSEYFTPKGKSIAKSGVTPDIQIDLSQQQLIDYYNGRLPRDQDIQLIKAIEAVNDIIAEREEAARILEEQQEETETSAD